MSSDSGAAGATTTPGTRRPILERMLGVIERVGNKLPDPVMIFLVCLIAVWVLSKLLAGVEFTEIDPRTKEAIRIKDQLAPKDFIAFLIKMVTTFTAFPPLGVVLVTLLGVGVAEHVGFINAILKKMLAVTPRRLLTPMVVLAGLASHSAADAGYVLVIPLGGVIFYTVGRHPLAGIAAAFAGVAGGFSANFVPSSLDFLLRGLTQKGVDLVAPHHEVNALCNWYFMSAACLVIVAVGWYITERLIEPKLRHTAVDGDPNDMPVMHELAPREVHALWWALGVLAACILILVVVCWPEDSVLRVDKQLTHSDAALMKIIVPLLFFFFLFPAIVYGVVAGTVKSHRDIVAGMARSMSSMGYYMVMAFFAAQFIYAFTESGLGALLAIKGGNFLRAMDASPSVTVVGIILITTTVNLFIGSASAKWALLALIFVPMLAAVGLSPELTQAAYRVGDSSTNPITPLNPYFALVVLYCQRYVKGTGVGTLTALMLPYSIAFLVAWTGLLLVFWGAGFPLGVGATYDFTP